MKHSNDDEYITRGILREEMQKEFQKFEARMDTKMDIKMEILRRSIVDEVAGVIYDFMEQHSEHHFTAEKREQKERERGITRVESRVCRIETKLKNVAATLH